MSAVVIEIAIILLLLVINGVFAMTEIAVVSANRARLRRLAEAGEARAKLALEFADSPNRFLSTVQIGITLVGILAGAFGGATIAGEIARALRGVPAFAPYGEGIGIAVVVAVITCLSLVLGELVPKRIGLANPEGVSMRMAGPMHFLAIIAAPAVKFLSASTDALLGLFSFRPKPEATVTEEEVQGLMQEGLRAGAFNKVESQIVGSALQLDRLMARDLMTPRPKILWLNKDDSHDAIWHKVVVSGHSNFPVYEGSRDNAAGIVSLKSIYANLAAGAPVRIADLMTPALVIPDSQPAIELLETFKQSRKHIALVADEFGAIVGLVTLHDIMEAVIGEFPSPEERARPRIQPREDGSWLIDGLIEIGRLEETLPGIQFGAGLDRDYQTLAGFVVKQLGHLPKEGETFERQGYLFEVLDMDCHRVDKVLVTPVPHSAHREVPRTPPSAGKERD